MQPRGCQKLPEVRVQRSQHQRPQNSMFFWRRLLWRCVGIKCNVHWPLSVLQIDATRSYRCSSRGVFSRDMCGATAGVIHSHQTHLLLCKIPGCTKYWRNTVRVYPLNNMDRYTPMTMVLSVSEWPVVSMDGMVPDMARGRVVISVDLAECEGAAMVVDWEREVRGRVCERECGY